MRLATDIVGVVLTIQGLGPLVQSAIGADAEESAFLTNQVPELMPWTAVAAAVAGVALLGLGRWLASRPSQGGETCG